MLESLLHLKKEMMHNSRKVAEHDVLVWGLFHLFDGIGIGLVKRCVSPRSEKSIFPKYQLRLLMEPSVRTPLIRLCYTDLSSRMERAHRSCVINKPLPFDFQLEPLSCDMDFSNGPPHMDFSYELLIKSTSNMDHWTT